MTRRVFLPALLLLTTGCVSTAQFKAKEDEAAKNAALAAQLEKELADIRASLAAAEGAKKELEAAKEAELAQAKKNFEELEAGLKSEIAAGEIKLTQLQGKLTVNMVDRILFDSGSAKVKATGMKVLEQIGKVLKEVKDKDIRIEGHTDNVPISPKLESKFPSNWELSAARATAVARHLQSSGIEPSRLVVVGFGENRPISPNDTPEHRMLNRRIEIVLTARD